MALNYDTRKKRCNHNHYTSKHATSYNEHEFLFQSKVISKMCRFSSMAVQYNSPATLNR